MRFREPMQLLEGYSAAWSYRAALGRGHRCPVHRDAPCGRYAFLKVDNPILDFVVEYWEASTPPDQFERDFSRRWWMLFGGSLTRATGANIAAIRAVLKNFS